MILKNLGILHGENLDYISSTNIKILKNNIVKIGKIETDTSDISFDCEGLIMVPGLINSHTHIADSIAKDINLDADSHKKINPIYGMKKKILDQSISHHVISYMKNTCHSMIKNGITTFVDFREGGINGIQIIKNALNSIPIRSIILGRLEYYQDQTQIKKNMMLPNLQKNALSVLIKNCDGIGISGANEYSDNTLQYFSNISKIKAIHSAETLKGNRLSKHLTTKSETERSMLLKPTFLIHMTHASIHDLQIASRNTHGIVLCPRANGVLAEGVPNVYEMIKSRCNLLLGTDNVMLNSPDIFREMDYLWKITMGLNKKRFDPKIILKMATTNADKVFHRNIGIIRSGKLADCVFINKHDIDIDPINNLYASIIHRVSRSTIRAVMIDGKIIHGKI